MTRSITNKVEIEYAGRRWGVRACSYGDGIDGERYRVEPISIAMTERAAADFLAIVPARADVVLHVRRDDGTTDSDMFEDFEPAPAPEGVKARAWRILWTDARKALAADSQMDPRR